MSENVEKVEQKAEERQPYMLLPEERPKYRFALIPLEELPKALPGPEPTKEMVESVRTLGILQPILVLWRNDKYEVRAGRRRTKAARAAGLVKIPAHVYQPEDVRGAILTLVENTARCENPVAEAEAIMELLKSGASEHDVAVECGVPVATIRARMKLMNDLHPELKAQLKKGKLSVSVAHRASKLPTSVQERLVEKLKESKKLTMTDVSAELVARRAAATTKLAMTVEAEMPPVFARRVWLDRVTSQLRALLSIADESTPEIAKVVAQLKKALAVSLAEQAKLGDPATTSEEPAS